MITQQEILQFKKHGSWRELVALAAEIAADAERHAGGASMNPLMGWGNVTRAGPRSSDQRRR